MNTNEIIQNNFSREKTKMYLNNSTIHSPANFRQV